MLGPPSLKVLSIKLFASLGIQGDLLHQRGLHRLQVGIVVSMTQGGNGGDGDRSNLTTPPPLTRSIGERARLRQRRAGGGGGGSEVGWVDTKTLVQLCCFRLDRSPFL